MEARRLRVGLIVDHPPTLELIKRLVRREPSTSLVFAVEKPEAHEEPSSSVGLDHSSPVCGLDVVVIRLRLVSDAVALGVARRWAAAGVQVISYPETARAAEALSSLTGVTALPPIFGPSELRARIADACKALDRGGSSHVLTPRSRAVRLPPREREAALRFALGESIRTVAQSMNISSATVRSFLKRTRGRYVAQGRPVGTRDQLMKRLGEDDPAARLLLRNRETRQSSPLAGREQVAVAYYTSSPRLTVSVVATAMAVSDETVRTLLRRARRRYRLQGRDAGTRHLLALRAREDGIEPLTVSRATAPR